MHPIAFEIFNFKVRSFTVFSILAVLVALMVFQRHAARLKWSLRDSIKFVFGCTIIGFFGAHLSYAFTRLSLPWNDWVRTTLNFGYGFVWYGGLFSALGFGVWFSKQNQTSFLKVFDSVAPALALAQATGRLGCFFGGCCYGKPTTWPWGVYLSTPDFGFARLHPVQVYESLFLVGIFLLLIQQSSRFKKAGQLGVTYIVAAAIGRFLLEFFRGDQIRGFLGFGLSTSQAISLCVIIVGVGVYQKLSAKNASTIP